MQCNRFNVFLPNHWLPCTGQYRIVLNLKGALHGNTHITWHPRHRRMPGPSSHINDTRTQKMQVGIDVLFNCNH